MEINYQSLIEAIKYSPLNEIKALITKDVNLNYKDDYGDTFLTVAAEHGKKSVVEFLLKEGANCEVSNNNQQTPLFIGRNFLRG